MDKTTNHENESSSSSSSSSSRHIFTPNYLPDPVDYTPPESKYPKTYDEWKKVIEQTNKDYIESFDGFFANHGISSSSDDDKDTDKTATIANSKTMEFKKQMEEINEEFQEQISHVKENVNRNVDTLKEEGPELIEEVKKTTGIRNKEDLKEFASSMMILAKDCLSEFTDGYKKGRDEEVDKMLNEYFNEIDDENDDSKERMMERRLYHRRRKRRLRV